MLDTNMDRRKFLITGAALLGSLSIRFRLGPTSTETARTVIKITPQIMTSLQSLLDTASFGIGRFYENTKAEERFLLKASQSDGYLPSREKIISSHKTWFSHITHNRVQIQNARTLTTEIVKKWRDGDLLNLIRKTNPEAVITDIELDETALAQLERYALSQLSDVANIFTDGVFAGQNFGGFARTILHGTNQTIGNALGKFQSTMGLIADRIETAVQHSLRVNLHLRKATGHNEETLKPGSLNDLAVIKEPSLKDIIPRIRHFSNRTDAYMITGFDQIIEHEGKTYSKPLADWFDYLPDFAESLNNEITVVGEEEDKRESVLVRVQANSGAQRYFQQLNEQQNSKSIVTR